MTVLVLLAAGSSKRFKGEKLLYCLEGKPMYRYIADRADELPWGIFGQKILVTQYRSIAEDLGQRGYQVVENTQPELGISHSIHLALEALDPEAEAVCFAVCDQPYLKKDTLLRLLTQWKESKKGIGCLSFDGEPGNPVVFSVKYKEELLKLTGDTGGKRVVKSHLDDVFLCQADQKQELEDIDYREKITRDKRDADFDVED